MQWPLASTTIIMACSGCAVPGRDQQTPGTTDLDHIKTCAACLTHYCCVLLLWDAGTAEFVVTVENT